MPFVGRPCGAAIHFTVRGTGPIPVLLLAPGGMRSHEGQWGLQPYDPLRALPREERRDDIRALRCARALSRSARDRAGA